MFWHNHASRAPVGLLGILLAASLALLISLTAGAAPASAGSETFCAKSLGYNEICVGTRNQLTASRGENTQSGVGCGGEAYGMYTCALPAGCMAYNGAAMRTPSIRHRAYSSRNMLGFNTFGSTPKPYWCDAGTPYRLAGPVTTADPVGVPVLEERSREKAPSAVAKLWSTADPSAARHFETPDGEDGWVMVLPSDRKVCMAVEVADTGYGYSCQSYNKARLQGAVMTIEDSNLSTAKGDLAVALTPEGSDGLEISRRDGSVKTVAPVDGVAAVVLGASDTVVELDAPDDSGLPAQRFSVGKRR